MFFIYHVVGPSLQFLKQLTYFCERKYEYCAISRSECYAVKGKSDAEIHYFLQSVVKL